MAETRSKPKSTPANGARTRTADLHDRVTRLETRFDSEVRYLATKEDIAELRGEMKQDMAAMRQENVAMETRIIKWVAGFGIGLAALMVALNS